MPLVARWLLADVHDEWDLGIVVVSEPHGAAEGFWHGIDPDHPLHHHPSAPIAAEGLVDVYRATDRLVGELIEATGPRATVLFTLGGMGSNHSDVASMALLPELLLRWSSGERLLEVPDVPAAEPGQVPLATGGDASWQRTWYPRASSANAARGPVRGLACVLPWPGAPLVEAGPRRRAGSPRDLPTGYQDLEWQPAVWYQPWRSRMRVFALPSFYDGRVRIDLAGRERDGIVDVADYDRVCDEIEALVRDCRDPWTGEPIVAEVERCAGSADPARPRELRIGPRRRLERRGGRGQYPVYGVVGPLPYRRTGGHTGPFGFVFVDAPDVAPGDLGVAVLSFDVALDAHRARRRPPDRRRLRRAAAARLASLILSNPSTVARPRPARPSRVRR